MLSQPTGQPGYVVTVRNKNWFCSTEGLIFSFRLLADGLPIKQEADEAWTEFDIAQIPPQVQAQPEAIWYDVLPMNRVNRVNMFAASYSSCRYAYQQC